MLNSGFNHVTPPPSIIVRKGGPSAAQLDANPSARLDLNSLNLFPKRSPEPVQTVTKSEPRQPAFTSIARLCSGKTDTKPTPAVPAANVGANDTPAKPIKKTESSHLTELRAIQKRIEALNANMPKPTPVAVATVKQEVDPAHDEIVALAAERNKVRERLQKHEQANKAAFIGGFRSGSGIECRTGVRFM